MIQLKIKEKAKKSVVGYNNSAKPLGERTDLLELAIIAREANDPFLLGKFEGEVPSLADLKKEKEKSIPAPTQPAGPDAK